MKILKKIIIISGLLLSNNIFANNQLDNYDIIEIEDPKQKAPYNQYIDSLPFIEDKESLNYNLYTFSQQGKIINHRVLNFVNNHFTQILYTVNSFAFLYNIDPYISGLMSKTLNEQNVIKKRMLGIDFFNEIKEKYKLEQKKYLELSDNKFHNEVGLINFTEYDFEKKEMYINFQNAYEKSMTTSLFCSKDIKFAYIHSHQLTTANINIPTVNLFVPIYIYLPEEITELLQEGANNTCHIHKKFKNDLEAIDMYDILNNGKNRFLLEFKINKEQKNEALFLEATAEKFGLYKNDYGVLKEYEVFKNKNFEEKSITNIIDDVTIEKNGFKYSLDFDINDYFVNRFFYPAELRNGIILIDKLLIKFDMQNGKSYVIGNPESSNKFKSTYTLEKKDNYYYMKLDKIHNFKEINIPREIYLFKRQENIDLFFNYNYQFNNRILKVNFLDRVESEF